MYLSIFFNMIQFETKVKSKNRKEKMKKILKNAKIYTVNKNRDWAEAVVIDDDKIVYVGTNEGADAYADNGAEVKDMQGKMILPGLIDGHIHTLGAGVLPSGIILGGLTTKEEIFETIKKYINENPDDECYFGMGWLESIFGDKGPNKADLDAITDKPIALISASCHTCWANSKAFELANITKDTPDPIPNVQFFMRDENGEPTGYCIENKPLNMVFSGADYIPMDKVFPALSYISQQLVSEGITTSAGLGIIVSLYGTGHPFLGVFCLMFCGFCDAFDGKVARTKKNRTEQEIKFGIQIDSLSDLVAFGVLPACR